MPNYRRANAKGGTYFFTVVTYGRQTFLCDETVRNALRDGIRNTQTTHPFTIDAWVFCRIICIASGRFHQTMQTSACVRR